MCCTWRGLFLASRAPFTLRRQPPSVESTRLAPVASASAALSQTMAPEISGCRTAKEAIVHAGNHAFRGRKLKKRVYRNVFTLRINAAAREYGFSYSRMIDALKKAGITLDRKSLSTLAKDHPEIFARIAKQLKA